MTIRIASTALAALPATAAAAGFARTAAASDRVRTDHVGRPGDGRFRGVSLAGKSTARPAGFALAPGASGGANRRVQGSVAGRSIGGDTLMASIGKSF